MQVEACLHLIALIVLWDLPLPPEKVQDLRDLGCKWVEGRVQVLMVQSLEERQVFLVAWESEVHLIARAAKAEVLFEVSLLHNNREHSVVLQGLFSYLEMLVKSLLSLIEVDHAKRVMTLLEFHIPVCLRVSRENLRSLLS